MDLHLTCDTRDHVRLFVNGALVAEIAVAQCDTRDTLAAEVAQARGLQRLARQLRLVPLDFRQRLTRKDAAHPRAEAQQAAILRGLLDGLEGHTHPHPQGPMIPPIRPEASQSYERGYEQGEALARYVRYTEGKEEGQA